MKKVILDIRGFIKDEDAKGISEALNSLSGVVAADVDIAQKQAYAYSGDRLTKETIKDAAIKAGYEVAAIKEEYLRDFNDLKV